jgi:3-deoxy-manno-octulosonate cytidylyltransferase (CMP-KDO synthetase)
MISSRVLGVIPARLGSTRLPRKMLRTIAGRPLLAWVYEAARTCPQLDDVIVAVDSPEVESLCRDNQWPCVMTSPDLLSGTDRLHAVAQHHSAAIYVNIQGDEPMLKPAHITALLGPFAHSHVDVTTLKVPCPAEEIANPNAVKVVTALDGRALYFSRATIPFQRDTGVETPAGDHIIYKHLGLYAYRAKALDRFASLQPSSLEKTERLEQLRLLENGLSLYVAEAPCDTVGVDTEEDLLRVESLLMARISSISH